MLRQRRPQHASSSPGETGFQRRWWGRRQPLEPDPRNMSAAVSRMSPPSPPHVDRLRRLSMEDSGGSGCAPPSCPWQAWQLCWAGCRTGSPLVAGPQSDFLRHA